MKKVQGFLTVEAALVLPAFIMTICSLLIILKVIYIHEQVQFSLSEAANQMAATTYLLDKTGLLDLEQQTIEQTSEQQGIVEQTATQLAEDALNQIIGCNLAQSIVNQSISEDCFQKWGIVNGKRGMDYSRSEFLMGNEDIVLAVQYEIKMPFFRHLLGDFRMRQQVCVRAFTGNENFESMYEITKKEEEGEDQKEWVYVTTNGTVYHQSRYCRYIDVKVKAKTYGEIKDVKRICEVCKDRVGELNDLSVIYTTDRSNIFHVALDCSEVKRNVSKMLLNEAISKGLGLCQLCKEEGHEQDVYLE